MPGPSPPEVIHNARRRRTTQPGWVNNGDMTDNNAPERYVSLAQVADLLDLSVDEVLRLVHEGRLRGARVGAPAQWRVAERSVGDYLDEQR